MAESADGQERVCPRCGSVAGDQRFCASCGLNLGSQSELPTRAEWDLKAARERALGFSGNKPCPRCGAEGFESGSTFCASCGWRDPAVPEGAASDWYEDPANPGLARFYDAKTRTWQNKPRRIAARPIPDEATLAATRPGDPGGNVSGLRRRYSGLNRKARVALWGSSGIVLLLAVAAVIAAASNNGGGGAPDEGGSTHAVNELQRCQHRWNTPSSDGHLAALAVTLQLSGVQEAGGEGPVVIAYYHGTPTTIQRMGGANHPGNERITIQRNACLVMAGKDVWVEEGSGSWGEASFANEIQEPGAEFAFMREGQEGSWVEAHSNGLARTKDPLGQDPREGKIKALPTDEAVEITEAMVAGKPPESSTSSASTAEGTATKPAGGGTGNQSATCIGTPEASAALSHELSKGCGSMTPPSVLEPLRKSQIGSIVWKGWGTANASGEGVLEANNCTPNCASGAYGVVGHVTIQLGDLRPGTCSGGSVQYYTAIRLGGPSSIRGQYRLNPDCSAAPHGAIAGSWPSGTSAWTVVLASDATSGEAKSEEEKAAKAGLPETGTLQSSQHNSLRPGYWVAYTGVLSHEAAIQRQRAAREAGFSEAYARYVSAE